ncbi:SAM-dependent methyltransferase [Ferrimonas sp. YFM]|uniref:SAM-dependent methyltransferase n=1 Tax=Ferrimonas sp. YFM TaxID=3028878 RepID=UPI00257260F4|nr:SAM-dependent methyltransferase [Ferrimonas sp. YFM]BDY07030.1 tRNA (N6-threonylcarbamoyladenosine(37)-N6)-methyltransferase TrmO [Ferrimonas sp. YFM]
MNAELTFIGHIETPYHAVEECPSNVQKDGPLCTLVLEDQYVEGLTALEVGQRILVLYWFHDADRQHPMLQVPFHNPEADPVGTFALRSPHRPNPIAASEVTIESIDHGRVQVRGLDCLSGTRLLDIKPAVRCCP